MRILLVDDDVDVTGYVQRELEDEGHAVSVCHDGAAGLRAAELHAFDIIVVDVMMPFMDGLEVTRRLRSRHIQTPVLLLTARDAPEEVVRGLESGADDYLTKPFSLDVLLARIRVRTRPRDLKGQRLRFADLSLDAATREVWRGTRQIGLTRTEFAILECLMRASGRVVTRDTLVEEVWGEREVTYNNLEVFIRFLRAKLDCAGRPSLIHTERGLGYRLRSPEP
ncbi:MAG: DNA-binding response regulator [Acidobacteria bacterium RIFCSPLOWO2_02_FULL_68_18]|nr:MAG: DNA-binding response regulator [Acidobacteria bacterium RIFCSPLOWO2_02_FULL_68_18]OFW49293.1 MAG: DNA-binding response regulator [Acidobacteria bacterium RIFCSPLOWO2_12_FULL_68_19]